jgi:uncharacterized protein YndB with AHSA1/START domain
MPFAHVAGVPVEELLPALGGASGLLLLARGWMALQLRRLGRDDRCAMQSNLRVTSRLDGGTPMAEQTDRIERHVLIAAPVERVWELITTAEHLSRWFADAAAEIDLRPGGAMSLTWQRHGTVHGRVETVDPPHRFAYRWVHTRDAPEDAAPGNSTLTEFTLAAEGDGTRVSVVESGFDALDLDDTARAELFASHSRGWALELDDLVDHAAGSPAGR